MQSPRLTRGLGLCIMEVAEYQIAQRVRDGAALALDIRDNGRGLPQQLKPGIGICSTKERAEDLDGFCRIEFGARTRNGHLRTTADRRGGEAIFSSSIAHPVSPSSAKLFQGEKREIAVCVEYIQKMRLAALCLCIRDHGIGCRYLLQ